MHILRRSARRKDGSKRPYILLREHFLQDGRSREHVLHLGPERADDLLDRAKRVLRRTGYAAAQIREILLAVEARVETNTHRSIAVRGRPVEWRDPKKA